MATKPGADCSGAGRVVSLSAPFGTDQLVRLLEHAYDYPTWHGSNLREALADVELSQALWQSSPERHNIWELVLHCAFWKHVVIRRLEGFNDDGGFSRTPKDFPALPEATQSAWENDLGLLEATHRQLMEQVRAFHGARLNELIGAGESRTFAELIFGVANHDIYHAGQIRLLLRLQGVEA